MGWFFLGIVMFTTPMDSKIELDAELGRVSV